MIRALYTAASGMNSQQMNLDVIANNLANVNTTGFKKSKIEFQDLLYDTKKIQGAEAGDGQLTPGGIQLGHGSRPVSTSKVFTTGDLVQTDERLDVAIAGDGFFEVQLPGGIQGYTRDGSFKVSADGAIVTNEGYQVVNAIPNIGAEVTNIGIAKTGEYTMFDQQGNNIGAGQIQITRFINPGGLQNIGGNIYQETPASGVPEQGNPGQNGFGGLAQGYLEMSNVKVVEEMVNLIKAQRAYEVNSKAIQAADEMMQMSNRLRG